MKATQQRYSKRRSYTRITALCYLLRRERFQLESNTGKKGALVGQGRTADIYAWDSQHIVKLFFAGFPEVAIRKEHQINRQVHEAGLPTPAVGQIVELDGRTGIVYERVDGPTMLHVILNKPWLLVRLARQLAEIQADIHTRTTADLPSQRERLHWEIERAPALNEAIRREILQALARLPEGNRICHGDLHPDNILMTVHGPVVIDWMNAVCGNPLADVARSVLMFSLDSPPPGASLLQRGLIRALRRLFLAAYIRRYRQLSRFARADMEAWLLPVAAARLFEGIPGEADQLLKLIESLISR